MLTDKTALRREALARRDALLPTLREAAAETVAEAVLSLLRDHVPGPVAGYVPIRSEIDPRPAMRRLAEHGFSPALPRIAGEDLAFHAAPFDAPLVRGPFGLSEPAAAAPVVRPMALLVPMAAFDRCGHRIGYGRGFYDRAIARLVGEGRVLTIGLAFAVQEVASVPAETHDRALDWIATEREVMKILPSGTSDAPSFSR